MPSGDGTCREEETCPPHPNFILLKLKPRPHFPQRYLALSHNPRFCLHCRCKCVGGHIHNLQHHDGFLQHSSSTCDTLHRHEGGLLGPYHRQLLSQFVDLLLPDRDTGRSLEELLVSVCDFPAISTSATCQVISRFFQRLHYEDRLS